MTLDEIYLELLRAGLWNRPAAVSGSVNLAELIEAASRQTTAPAVYRALLDKYGSKLKDQLREKLESDISRCAKSHGTANSVIAFTVGELSRKGIAPVLLKGQGIASWYPVPTLRQAGDIDLYVKEYDRACAILEGLFGPKESENSKHASFHVGGTLEIELHRYTETLPKRRDNAFYAGISDEGTSNNLVPVTLCGTDVMTPEDTFNAFYIFHHLWTHMRAMGIGMRQLCDWAALLRARKEHIDTERLKYWLKELRLLDVWQVFGCTAVEALQLDPSEVPFYDASKASRGHKLLEFILAQGNNSEFKHGRSRKSALKHKTGSLRYIHKRLGLMFPIFPGEALSQYFRDVKNGILKIFHRASSNPGVEE